MEITATELKNKLGKYLDVSRVEPVIVDKTGRKTAVLLSYEEYKRLTELEDAYWAQKALQAEQEGYVGTEKSMAFLKKKHA
ncbi:MAG: type II toxin-antitoxin system Phd/YefM family antitoxin [Thermodesulfobacteriota bacterium]